MLPTVYPDPPSSNSKIGVAELSKLLCCKGRVSATGTSSPTGLCQYQARVVRSLIAVSRRQREPFARTVPLKRELGLQIRQRKSSASGVGELPNRV
jgi:hypothetical protein